MQKLGILIGVNPLRSAKSAAWMKSHLFGTIIPDAFIKRMEKAGDPIAEGRRICLDVIAELADIPGVAGCHIMAPGNDAVVPDIIAAARDSVKRLTPV
jgi:methylenetetrahydrofolate reductase (NADPH)